VTNDQTKNFGETAKSLARNPLGIIALFIVMVYGFASLVTAFAGSFTAGERLPLIYFLICFPVLVLCVFAWLVSKHTSSKVHLDASAMLECRSLTRRRFVRLVLLDLQILTVFPLLVNEAFKLLDKPRQFSAIQYEIDLRVECLQGDRLCSFLTKDRLEKFGQFPELL